MSEAGRRHSQDRSLAVDKYTDQCVDHTDRWHTHSLTDTSNTMRPHTDKPLAHSQPATHIHALLTKYCCYGYYYYYYY